MQTLTKSFQEKVKSFGSLLTNWTDNTQRLADALVDMLGEREDAMEIIVREYRVPLSLLEGLERVGLKKLLPQFLTDNSPAAQRVIAAALPIAEQKKIAAGYVTVVKPVDGGFKEEQKRYHELNHVEAALAIGRTVQEQKAVLIEREQARVEREKRFIIHGDHITFNQGATFTWSEIDRICEPIKPKATDIESSVKRNQICRA